MRYGGNLHSDAGTPSTPNYAAINNLEIARGRAIDEADYNVRSRVIVLGPETAQALFPDDIDPLDQDVRVNGINFRVIGLLTEKGAAGIGGSQDDIALIPDHGPGAPVRRPQLHQRRIPGRRRAHSGRRRRGH